MVVVGGQAPKAIRSVECYDFKEERWHQVAELPSRRCRAGKHDALWSFLFAESLGTSLSGLILLIRRIFTRKALIKIDVSLMPQDIVGDSHSVFIFTYLSDSLV